MEVLKTEQVAPLTVTSPSQVIKTAIPVRRRFNVKAHAREADVCKTSLNEEMERQTVTHTHTPFPGISQLLPHLYLCGAGAAMPDVLDKLNVRFIINVAPELPDTPLSNKSRPLYLRIQAMDRSGVDLSQYFDEVADMIEEVRQHGGKSLVHCVAGVSRSATLCLAYLMRHMGMNLREAYLHVKAIRPQIRPNSGFFEQLRLYEQKLRGGESSVHMIYFASLDREIPDVYEPEYRAMEDFYQRHREAFRKSVPPVVQQVAK